MSSAIDLATTYLSDHTATLRWGSDHCIEFAIELAAGTYVITMRGSDTFLLKDWWKAFPAFQHAALKPRYVRGDASSSSHWEARVAVERYASKHDLCVALTNGARALVTTILETKHKRRSDAAKRGAEGKRLRSGRLTSDEETRVVSNRKHYEEHVPDERERLRFIGDGSTTCPACSAHYFLGPTTHYERAITGCYACGISFCE
jgi:hypothetical protein